MRSWVGPTMGKRRNETHLHVPARSCRVKGAVGEVLAPRRKPQMGHWGDPEDRARRRMVICENLFVEREHASDADYESS